MNKMRPPAAAMRLCATVLALGLGAAAASAQSAANGCGSLANPAGPFDYRNEREMLQLVEGHHFGPPVEALLRGVSGTVGADIAYVLRWYPNHHRALLAMTRLYERQKWAQPEGAQWSIDCYYERALRFRSDDVIVRLLFASYLAKRGRNQEAAAQLGQVTVDAGDNGFTHYNVGLQYFELGLYDQALESAHRALQYGFPRTDLADRLRAAGRWKEPPTQATTAAPAASAPN